MLAENASLVGEHASLGPLAPPRWKPLARIGDHLREWIDACPNDLYSALMFRGGAAWRERLEDEIGDQGPVSALLKKRTDSQLAELMANLGYLQLTRACAQPLCPSSRLSPWCLPWAQRRSRPRAPPP